MKYWQEYYLAKTFKYKHLGKLNVGHSHKILLCIRGHWYSAVPAVVNTRDRFVCRLFDVCIDGCFAVLIHLLQVFLYIRSYILCMVIHLSCFSLYSQILQ